MIGQDQGVLSRWETGDRNVKPEQVARILTTLGVNGNQYEDIVALAHRPDEPIWVATTPAEHRQHTMALLDCEQSANEITEIAPLIIPGLLQASGYTRAIMESAGLKQSEVAARVSIRAQRKDAITRSDPVRFRAAIGWAALVNIIGGKETMVEQLRHLLDMARLSHVVVRVLPGNGGWTPASSGQFYLFEFPQRSPLVHVENQGPLLFLHEREEVEGYRSAAEKVFDACLSAAESVDLIAGFLARLENNEHGNGMAKVEL